MPSYRGSSEAIRPQGPVFSGTQDTPAPSSPTATPGKGSYRGSAKAIHVPCPAIDTFSRIVPHHSGPPQRAHGSPSTPQRIAHYATYHPSDDQHAWGDSEFCGIGWTEDWSASIDGPYAESVEDGVGVIDLLATGSSHSDLVIACPCLFPLGYYDAAESAAAGKRIGTPDRLVFSYEFMYDITRVALGDPAHEARPEIYMSWWLSATRNFDIPPGAGDGITGTYYIYSSGALNAFMGIEFEIYEDAIENDVFAVPPPDPFPTNHRGDENFSLQFLLTDSRIKQPGSSNPGYTFKYGNLSNCNGRWIRVGVVVDAYGTRASAQFMLEDDEGHRTVDPDSDIVDWGEWSDDPRCPMGETGLDVDDYSHDGHLTTHLPPFNAYGSLEVDGQSGFTHVPSAAKFYYDNLSFCDSVEVTYGKTFLESSQPSYRGASRAIRVPCLPPGG